MRRCGQPRVTLLGVNASRSSPRLQAAQLLKRDKCGAGENVSNHGVLKPVGETRSSEYGQK